MSGVRLAAFVATVAVGAAPVGGQQASFVYRLGRDTLAIEQYTRTASRLVGEMVQRTPLSVMRTQYDIAIGPDSRPTSAVLRRRDADGNTIANNPAETRLVFTADSVRREIVWPDSVQRRTFAAQHAQVGLPVLAYGATELVFALGRSGASVDSIPAFGIGGNAGWIGLATVGGDTSRLRGSPYPMLLRFDREGRLLSVDGTLTTNKAVATRGTGGLDLGAIAAKLTPTGQLSTRGNATLTFQMSPIFIDYGRPLVRQRTVWGGQLIPFDSVWRAGANAATHLATTRTLVFGELVVPAGMYSLWIQHTRSGTFLIINKQTGQWGTSYDPAQDLGRVPMTLAPAPAFVEQFTITIRAMPPGSRGAFDFAFGPSVATATFVVRQGP